ncbi:MAG TPA: S8 family serine peptidase [Thermoanaerobaculaceae bacterium]|nr:S8 family serine peptidase [Thermoanaerobaculaceae bacterium]
MTSRTWLTSFAVAVALTLSPGIGGTAAAVQPTVQPGPRAERNDSRQGRAVVVIPEDWKSTPPFAERFTAARAASNGGGGHRIDLAAIRFVTDGLVASDASGRRVFSPPDLSSFVQQLIRTAFAGGGTDLFIVQANSPKEQSTLRAWLASSGIGILDYIPDLAYLVRLTQAQLAAVKQRADVFWAGQFQPAFMVEPTLEYVILRDPAHQLKLRANFDATEYPDAETLGAALQATPLTVLDITRMDDSWSVRLQGRALDAYVVALLPGCEWVERFVDFHLDNNIARTSTSYPTGRGANPGPIMDVENVWNKGIRGEGQIAATADTGLSTGNLATLHQDFGNQSDPNNPMRVLRGYILNNRATWNDNQTAGGGHGTHTAGSIVGNGFRSGSTPNTSTFPATCFAGIAPKAQFEIQSVMYANGSLGGLPADLTTLFQTPYSDGVRVHSNSWGASSTGAYNVDSQNVDKFVWTNKDMVITFSAGNDAVDTTPSDGVCDTDSIGTPATAKNCITAGASEDYRPDYQYEYPSGTCNSNPTWNWFDAASYPTAPISSDLMADNANGMGAFSSRGPCADGRFKPDLVAPGIAIISTRTDVNQAFEQWGTCNIPAAQKTYYLSMGGTSMANPLTAGSAVLVREYYATGWHPNNSQVTHGAANAPDAFNPTAALVKATLINGAWDMTPGQYGTGTTTEIPPGWDGPHDLPNDVEGYGRVDLYHSLFPNLGYGANASRALEVHDVSPGLTTGASNSYTFTVTDNLNPLIVTLVWTDPYGATSAATELVNNLDLQVKAPGATTLYYVPNRKDQTTTTATDTLNNVEQVYVTTPAVGAWSITVNGTSVPGNGVSGTTMQPYALVISGISCGMGIPTGLTATAIGNNRIDLAWSAVGGAIEYHVFRSNASGGPYTQVATVAAPATTYSDLAVNGGNTYYYVVRSYGTSGNVCESGKSNEASATANGICTLPPAFAGLASVTTPTTTTCTLNLSWTAATPQCSGSSSVTYAVYRSTTTGFAPSASNRIALGLTGTTYADTNGLASGTTYYYVVRATDTSNGVEETNTVQRSGSPLGALAATTLYSENFDGWAAGSLANWTRAYYTGNASDWRGVMACAAHTGANIFRYGGTNCTNNTASNRHAIAWPPAVSIVTGSTTARLSFWHKRQFGAGDGAYMRLSLDGATFNVVPSSAIISGPYNGTANGLPAWTGTSTNYPAASSFMNSVVDLDAACNAIAGGSGGCAGRTVYIGFTVYTNATGNSDGWFLDDVTVTANVPQSCGTASSPVQAFTATARSGSVELQWVNPTGTYGSTMVRYRTDGTFPTSAADGALACNQPGPGAGAKDSCVHSGLTNGTTYYYSAFVNNGSGVYSSGDTVSARPFDTTGALKWAYSTGASSLTPPGIWPGAIGIGEVNSVSNDRMLHAMNPTSAGGDWPSGWYPLAMNGPSQGWPWMIDIPFGGATREIFVASQDGHVYCVNGDTGAQVWLNPPLLGDVIQDGTAGIFTGYGGAYDLVFACTRNATSDNKVFALNPATGAILWTFDNGGGTNGIGIISSAPWVDYTNKRLYFTSRARGGGSSRTVWCISFTNSVATACTGFKLPAVGDVDAAPTLFQPTGAPAERLYVGTNGGVVYALDKDTGDPIWSSALGDGAIKGYVMPAWGNDALYCTTNTKLWCLTDNVGSATQTWGSTMPGGATPSMPLLVGSKLLLGGSDGDLYQYDTTQNPPQYTRVQLGTGGAAAGSPSYDNVNGLVVVGTEAGIIYAVDRSKL